MEPSNVPRKYIKKSEKRVSPEGQAPKTAKNPLGLQGGKGVRVTKTGKKKRADRSKSKPRPNIKHEPNWIEYAALKERPEGMTPFEKDENDNILVKHGELYCRVQEKTGELCGETRLYSDTGNLKHHIKNAHGLPIPKPAHNGCKSHAEVDDADKWFKQVMITHKKTVAKQKDELEKMKAKASAAKETAQKGGQKGKGVKGKGAKGRNGARASQAQAQAENSQDEGQVDSGIGMLSDSMEVDSDMEEVIQPTTDFVVIE